MWISETWYERLPALYAVAGLLTLALLGQHRAAQMSTMLLLGAAGLVRHWRRVHRS